MSCKKREQFLPLLIRPEGAQHRFNFGSYAKDERENATYTIFHFEEQGLPIKECMKRILLLLEAWKMGRLRTLNEIPFLRGHKIKKYAVDTNENMFSQIIIIEKFYVPRMVRPRKFIAPCIPLVFLQGQGTVSGKTFQFNEHHERSPQTNRIGCRL